MELRHLRYFVAVAEERSFTRAAERLGIKQPPLSLQIRQLEKEMGTPLFRRLTRGVELTAAGKLFLGQARSILHQVNQAKIDVKRRGRGDTGEISLGLSGACFFHPLVSIVLSQFIKLYPDVTISPQELNSETVVAAVRAGKFDAGFVRTPPPDVGGLVLEPIVEENTVIAFPEANPFCCAASVALSALAKEKFIVTSRDVNASFHDAVIMACERAGFHPILGPPGPGVVSVIAMVAAGLGISIVPQSMTRLRLKGICYVPIKGYRPKVPINLAHRLNDQSPAVRNLVALVRRSALPAVQERETA